MTHIKNNYVTFELHKILPPVFAIISKLFRSITTRVLPEEDAQAL